MPTRVAINGFGRIGRCVVRSAYEHGADVEIVAVNDVADPATLAHLLRFDSVFGRFPADVAYSDGVIRIDDQEIRALSEREPASLPWADLGVDVVIESTGRFRTRADAAQHLEAGGRKVIISAPGKGSEPVDANVVLGVNFDEVYDPEAHHIITNSRAPPTVWRRSRKFSTIAVGIRHGQMTTIHAYTSDQSLIDGPHTDLRRARAAAVNLVPTSTGAAKAVGLVIPSSPAASTGSPCASRPHRLPSRSDDRGRACDVADEINQVFKERADSGALQGILAYSDDPIVSTDIVKSPYSSIFDAPLTGRHQRHSGQGRRLV